MKNNRVFGDKWIALLLIIGSILLILINWNTIGHLLDEVHKSFKKEYIDAKILEEEESFELEELEKHLSTIYPCDRINFWFTPVKAQNEDGSRAHFLEIEIINPIFLGDRDPSLFGAIANEIALEIYKSYPNIEKYPGFVIEITKYQFLIITSKRDSATYAYLISELESGKGK